MVIGHADFGEEHFIERRPARHLSQRPNLHAGSMHIHDEPGEAFVLGQVWVGPADHLAEVRELGAGGPHLLTSKDPFVAVFFGLHLEAGEVRPGARFGEQLTADDVAPPHLLEVCRLRCVAGVSEDRRGDHAEADLKHTEIRGGKV